ncbi:hypothetical protein B7R25_10315 [Subtercola boreus]|uniref:DNA 3'-5' helicase n=1 Tax=Subtercola boreus TaxID=120213 RepID=A0A3E0WBV9_9MICO|nr:hypothetical protein B7R24_10250 [Subtercola boreus]RFA20202.1 hypothetical protein B7R23_10190 [Subtercola boreus]RFA26527.1 hypothetical protein B7R25_10315 [Subtercola boreus]
MSGSTAPADASPSETGTGTGTDAGARGGLSLDASQSAVLALADGVSASVIGAPGSGKTGTLVEVVAERVLVRGYAASEVLALTPTRQSATRLRDRLALRLGLPTNGPLARTVNSLAFQIVQGARAASGAEPPVLLTGSEHDRIIADLLDGHLAEGLGPEWPDPLTADVRALRGFRTELRELLMRATEDGISPEALQRLGREHGVPEWVSAGQFAREYQDVVASFRDASLDAAELIAAARLELATGNPLFGSQVLTGVRMIVVDDTQELSRGALNFLATLARRGVAVIAFGDPDVATTTFRGGEKDTLGRLGAVFGPRARTVGPLYLSTVYRHGAVIRSLVERATSRIGAAAAGQQRAARAVGASAAAVGAGGVAGADSADSGGSAEGAEDLGGVPAVRRIEAVSPSAETAAIAQLLREHHLLRGVAWRDMAVVVRSGALISSLVRSLALAEVPTATQTGGRALRDDYAARHLALAVAVAIGSEPLDDDRATELLLGPFGGLDAVALRRLRLALRQEELAGGGNRPAEALVRECLEDSGRLVTLDSAPARRARRFADALAAVRSQGAAGASIEELLWELWSRSGLATEWLKQSQGSGILAAEADRNLDGVVGLFSSATRFVERTPHRPAVDFLVDMLTAEVPEDSLSARSASDAVVVSTPNGVIGAQFEVVVVAGLQESVWPNLRLRGSLLHPDRLSAIVAGARRADVDERAEVLGDELRMFVLAVSRARTQVVLTCVADDDEQPSPFIRLAPEPPVSDRPAPAERPERPAPAPPARPAATAPPARTAAEHPLSLRALTGTLRRRLAETGDPAAADALARLAREQVAGADPASWYGLLEPSTLEPLVDLEVPENVVEVSPSKLETFEKSPLAWFIDKVSGSTFGLSAGIGTLLHSVMEEVTAESGADLSEEALWGALDERWNELQFESPWLGERERCKTAQKVRGLSEYLLDFERDGGALLGGEASFALDVGRARLRGTVDRVELRPDGRVSVVDLKTGASAPAAAAVARHAQLGSYQLALQSGAIGAEAQAVVEQAAVEAAVGAAVGAVDAAIGSAGYPHQPRVNGGAVLLYVALASGAGANRALYKLLSQAPLDEESVAFFRDRIETAALGMAGTTFPGREGLDEHDPHGSWPYRIHLVKAVSSR